MSDQRFVVVATFPDVSLAYLAKGHLEASGIPAFVSDENTGAIFGTALCWVKIHVAEEDSLRAVAVLEAQMPDEPPDESITAAEDTIERRDQIAAIDPEDEPEEQARREGVFTPDSEESEAIATIDLGERERLANRAFMAAIGGVLFLPLQLYASYVLLNYLQMEGPLSDRGRWRVGVAVVINLLFVLAIFLSGPAFLLWYS